MIDVISAIGDRFWVPFQVLEEFWRNRERALSSPLGDAKQSVGDLQKQLDSAREVIRMWVNKAALTSDAADIVERQLEDALGAARGLIEELVDVAQVNRARNTRHDPVLSLLDPVFADRVGPPLSDTEYVKAVAEGRRRAAAGEPPGFADVKKADADGVGAAGDYLVWEQVMVEAGRRSLDVVFVTGDVKKDWWRYEGNNARGPRLELVRELRRRCGTTLYMIQPHVLLNYADALAVVVEQKSVEDVERTTRADRGSTDSSDGGTGWTSQALDELLRGLSNAAPVQEATIRLAAQQEGYVSRDDVYRLGEYEPDRQLKGFTRPVNRLVQQMRDRGIVPDEATDLLLPVYEKMVHGFGWVDGFRVPAEIFQLLQDT